MSGSQQSIDREFGRIDERLDRLEETVNELRSTVSQFLAGARLLVWTARFGIGFLGLDGIVRILTIIEHLAGMK